MFAKSKIYRTVCIVAVDETKRLTQCIRVCYRQVNTHIHTHARTYAHTRTHTRTHTHTHTHSKRILVNNLKFVENILFSIRVNN